MVLEKDYHNMAKKYEEALKTIHFLRKEIS